MSVKTVSVDSATRARAARQPNESAGEFVSRKAKAYVALTKPRVIELLLVTTLPTMMFAERGFPSISLVLATLLGGAMAAGASGSFQNS